MKTTDFDTGDFFQFFGDPERVSVLRTYEDAIDTKKRVSIPACIMKTDHGRTNSVKVVPVKELRGEYDDFQKQRFDMPSTLFQRYVKCRGGYNHIIRVVWRRERPTQKYVIRNKLPMAQGAFFAKIKGEKKKDAGAKGAHGAAKKKPKRVASKAQLLQKSSGGVGVPLEGSGGGAGGEGM